MDKSKYISKIVALGGLNYPVAKMINVLDIQDEAAFRAAMSNPNSPEARAYQKGQDQAEFALDMALFNKAKSGDMKAMEVFKKKIVTNKMKK